ncbi:MAG: hypothetical protein GY754_22730 [bacterium]|nr:hypothetical protein [bacterium]
MHRKEINEIVDDEWDTFKNEEKNLEPNRTVRGLLKRIFYEKCAYCETDNATEIDHYIPKKPHSHNANRGSYERTFEWGNFLLSCSTCNGFGGKGSHMKWDGQGNPKLLNPFEDEPLCYFSIELSQKDPHVFGRIFPREGLAPEYEERAAYTISRLKLNQGHLLRGRKKIIRNVLRLIDYYIKLGPECKQPNGKPISEWLLEELQPTEPYLAAIRQVFCRDYPEFYSELIKDSELKVVLEKWALPAEDSTP